MHLHRIVQRYVQVDPAGCWTSTKKLLGQQEAADLGFEFEHQQRRMGMRLVLWHVHRGDETLPVHPTESRTCATAKCLNPYHYDAGAPPRPR